MPLVLCQGGWHVLSEIRNSRNATRHQWRWARDQFAEAPEILSDGCKGELELGAAWPPEPEPTEAQNAL
jgi:hypothetical protein